MMSGVVVSRRDVPRWTGTGAVGAPARWARLRERLSGELLLPRDDGYDTARLPFNSL